MSLRAQVVGIGIRCRSHFNENGPLQVSLCGIARANASAWWRLRIPQPCFILGWQDSRCGIDKELEPVKENQTARNLALRLRGDSLRLRSGNPEIDGWTEIR